MSTGYDYSYPIGSTPWFYSFLTLCSAELRESKCSKHSSNRITFSSKCLLRSQSLDERVGNVILGGAAGIEHYRSLWHRLKLKYRLPVSRSRMQNVTRCVAKVIVLCVCCYEVSPCDQPAST